MLYGPVASQPKCPDCKMFNLQMWKSDSNPFFWFWLQYEQEPLFLPRTRPAKFVTLLSHVQPFRGRWSIGRTHRICQRRLCYAEQICDSHFRRHCTGLGSNPWPQTHPNAHTRHQAAASVAHSRGVLRSFVFQSLPNPPYTNTHAFFLPLTNRNSNWTPPKGFAWPRL